MAQHRIRRLPVIKNEEIVGFVALADLSVPSETAHEASQALHEISEPRHLNELPKLFTEFGVF